MDDDPTLVAANAGMEVGPGREFHLRGASVTGMAWLPTACRSAPGGTGRRPHPKRRANRE